jgi:hypothetical protein
MNIRELTENGLAGAIARPIAGRLARKAAEKETEKEIGAVAVPRVKAQAQAIAKTQEKEKPQLATGIIFGRFNPPHKGHKAAWQMASKCAYWYVGTNESTQGPKDPLPYDVKVQAMLTVWPGIKGHLVSEISWLTLASHCFDKHKDSTTLICFTDEDWVTKTIQQYNGVKGAHGFYKFDEITQQPTPRLSSATALRTAVQSGDRNAFTKAAGISSETPVAGHPYFDLVAYYLAQFPEKAKKVKETARMSAAVKLQRAWDRERAKSSASYERERVRRELQGIADRMKPEEPKKAPSLSNDEITERFLDSLTNALLDEAKGGTQPIHSHHKAAIKNATTFPSMNQSTGSAYLGYRMGVALAGAPDYPTKQEADNWIGGDPLLSPYTDEENEMINQAAKQVGGGKRQTWSNNRSLETADVNKISTVAKPKRNKYGV